MALSLWRRSGPTLRTQGRHFVAPGPRGSGHEQLSSGKHRRVPASGRDPLLSPELCALGRAGTRAFEGVLGEERAADRDGLRGGPSRGCPACGSRPPPPGSARAPSRRAAGRPPGCPRPPRAPCGRSRGRRDASGRKRRRPCGEGGSASALGSAPAAPGGSTGGR